jgi:hypothetical protein
VQFARDPLALLLLGRQRAAAALAALALEAPEHLVERRRERLDLGVRVRHDQPPARLQRLDRAHGRGEPAQRRHEAPQHDQVDRDRDDEAGDDDRRLPLGDREVDLDRREQQQQGDDREYRRVREKHPGEQREMHE